MFRYLGVMPELATLLDRLIETTPPADDPTGRATFDALDTWRLIRNLADHQIITHAAQLDVCDPGSFADFHAAASVHGLPAMLVNNAGIQVMGPFAEQRLDVYHREVAVNLIGPINGMHTFLPGMLERNHGHIVNISSISRAGNMGQTNYSAAKAGVASATVVWAKELARYGIRVAGIAPGFIETEMVASMKPEALEKMTAGIPLRRMGKPEEIAHSLAYIIENDYYTGRILELDGGLRL